MKKYDHHMYMYFQERQIYIEQQKLISGLQSFISDTVKPSYQTACCNEELDIRDWYRNLKEYSKVRDSEDKDQAFSEFEKAVIPLKYHPKDYEEWIERWTSAMAKLERKKIDMGLTPALWLPRFMKAIRPLHKSWASSNEAVYRQQTLDGTLHYLTVANDFRREISGLQEIQRGRVWRGSFTAHQRQDSKKRQRLEGDQGGRSLSAKRSMSGSPHSRAARNNKCQVYERPYCRPNICFYANPDQAYEGWTPNPRRQAIAQANLNKMSQSGQQTTPNNASDQNVQPTTND